MKGEKHLEHGVIVESKRKEHLTQGSDAVHSAPFSQPPPVKFAADLAEYLFYDSNGKIQISRDSLAVTYRTCTQLLGSSLGHMIKSYEKLLDILKTERTETNPTAVCKPLGSFLNADLLQRLGLTHDSQIAQSAETS